MSLSNLDLAHVSQLIAVLLAAGLVAGFVAGLFGIGGGFVVVPALLLTFGVFNVDSNVITHLAIGTSLATIIVTSARSVHAHHQRGAVDFRIIRDWTLWLTVGAVLGILVARYMDGRSLKWIFSIGVFLMGVHFIVPVLQPKKAVASDMPHGLLLAGLATFLGAFSALLGIGGGTIAVLVMTACGRAIHQAVATAAGFGVLIAVPGAIGFAILGLGEPGLPFGSIGYVNVIAVLAITAMSFLTAPLGARAAHSLNAVALKRVFGIYLVATSAIVLYNSLTS
ncbi:MAG: permease [Hyphomonas sp. BRH_c22]|uniref:sulfite exporter TauE/SafE family protein n=1 Tax=Hyphomonas sp. BRH_c22 TaxID=1629710 RepID=UPI0005F2555C|nr:sulfite exporter TauE/SafE family protein [Hyphomonas sp. BRH_c22]KJS37900.1 MAG: permease [Hyphomonas sp. BRH_c22]